MHPIVSRVLLRTSAFLPALACTADVRAPTDDTGRRDTMSTDTAPLPAEAPEGPAFSFAVIADPHVTAASGGHNDRLDAALRWIDAHAAERDLRFVLVCGDVAWRDGMDWTAQRLLDFRLPVVPIVGDNELKQDEAAFSTAFAPVWEENAAELDGFTFADGPVPYPELDAGQAWFTNLAFTYEGVAFVGLDWASRIDDPILGEFADLHDVDGGTWRWFESWLQELPPGPGERVVLFTHNPMAVQFGGFDFAEGERLTEMMAPWLDAVAAAHGGHLHIDAEDVVGDGGDAGYDVILTDATWDDEVRVLVTDVVGAGGDWTYAYERITVPLP